MTDRGFPVVIKRFPVLDGFGVVGDGVLAVIDGKDVYLEGELAPASVMSEEVKDVNDRLKSMAVSERIDARDAVMSIHITTPNEMRVTSYVISALIVCFEGFGFEPQGNTYGRKDFADDLIRGLAVLKGL
ncbi:hypothetical protein ASE73_07480 [Sphingomonas sp. Leaf24]|nr:hypothetical protein ASE50_10750 [Sphingomonas sp. Leaf5]KQM89421.1 hypothetical protein ASE73_07480 [Sphingomonas sp. Leaf24]